MPNLTSIKMKTGVLMLAITSKAPSITALSKMVVVHHTVMNKMMMIKVVKISLVTEVRLKMSKMLYLFLQISCKKKTKKEIKRLFSSNNLQLIVNSPTSSRLVYQKRTSKLLQYKYKRKNQTQIDQVKSSKRKKYSMLRISSKSWINPKRRNRKGICQVLA